MALIVACRVEREVAQQLAVGAEHADVAVSDEHDHIATSVAGAHADVVELGVVAEGDGAGLVDAIVADPEVRVGPGRRRICGGF